MTLTKASRAWGVAVFIILATALAFFGGNQNLAHADVRSSAVRAEVNRVQLPPTFVGQDSLASQIICRVFTQLNELGEPIPFLDPGGVCPRDPQCSDGIDNDGDGNIDSADASCHLDFDAENPASYHPNIDAEDLEPTSSQCSDGVDNDSDGFIDRDDPNCHTDGDPSNESSYSPTIRDEGGSLPMCWNGIDDDEDGFTDYPSDIGCTSAIDTDETDPAGAQCSDGIDNDEDGFTDTDDPNCHTDGDATNEDSYNPDGSEDGALPMCSNGIDDDEDGLVDLDDPGCSSATDDDETDPTTAPQCSDGIDNDGDGDIDGNDPGCSGDDDDDETDPTNGGGSPPSVGGTAPSSGGGSISSGGGTITGLITGVGGSADAVIDQTTGAPIACDAYLTEFIKFGGDNDASQVVRLQRVLRDFEGESGINTDGVYDEATLAAVHRFQTKYADDILTPWGINQSTGFVFLTTRKKVNEVYCRNTRQFPLTPEERAKIEGTRQAIEGGATVGTAQTTDDPTGTTSGTSTVDAETGFDILLDQLGITDDDETQTAAAVDAVPEPDDTTTEDADSTDEESVWKKIIRIIRRGLSP